MDDFDYIDYDFIEYLSDDDIDFILNNYDIDWLIDDLGD